MTPPFGQDGTSLDTGIKRHGEKSAPWFCHYTLCDLGCPIYNPKGSNEVLNVGSMDLWWGIL